MITDELHNRPCHLNMTRERNTGCDSDFRHQHTCGARETLQPMPRHLFPCIVSIRKLDFEELEASELGKERSAFVLQHSLRPRRREEPR